MHCRWSAYLVVALACAALAPAETIVLKNGEHREGQIVSESADEVSLRTRYKGGNITYVEKIKRSDIVRIDKTTTPEDAVEPLTSEAPATQPTVPAVKIPDKPAFLANAVVKFQKPDFRGAGLDLTRLINASTPLELQQLSLMVQKELNMSLAELAATAHFEDAMQRSAGRAVAFQNVTEFEKRYLIPMIEDEFKHTINDPVVVPDDTDDSAPRAHQARRARAPDRTRGAERAPGAEHAQDQPDARAEEGDAEQRGAQRPANRRTRNARNASRADRRERFREDDAEDDDKPGKEQEDAEDSDARDSEKKSDEKPASQPVLTVDKWMRSQKEFDGTPAEARALAAKIVRANSLVVQRIQLDPAVKTDAALRAQLSKDRNRLNALLRSVRARAGGALTQTEREAQEAQRRNEMDAARRAEARRHNEIMEGLQKIVGEQQQQQPGNRAPGLNNPNLPVNPPAPEKKNP